MKIKKNQIKNLVVHLLSEIKVEKDENLVNECTEYLVKICESEKRNDKDFITFLFVNAKKYLEIISSNK